MGLGCGMSMVKYILFIFNLLCALCGVAILTIGGVYLIKYDFLTKVVDDRNVYWVPVFFVVIGAAIFIIAFFGCCGAIRESSCMVSVYAAFLFLLLVIQIIVGVWVLTSTEDVKEYANRFLKNLWKERHQPGNEQFWNELQRSFKCCGLNTALDWLGETPASCCEPNAIECISLVNAYKTGCAEAVRDFVGRAANIGGFVVIGVAAIELIGFIFACCLSNNIRNHSRRYA